MANLELGFCDQERGDLIAQAADEVIAGKLDDHFPLVVWQTGCGTQTNMNVNEVIAQPRDRARRRRAGQQEAGPPERPRQHVAVARTTRFPTAMHIAAVEQLERLPAAARRGRCATRSTRRPTAFADIVKIGRTHLQDATPLTLGQEISGWVAQLDHALKRIDAPLPHLYELALGGTAVGTGLNTHPEFARQRAAKIARAHRAAVRHARRTSSRRWPATTRWSCAHGALKTLAAALMKIANDVRWLASRPALRARRAHASRRTSPAARSCRAR